MSNTLSAQHWETSHRMSQQEVTKQSSIEDKEAYLMEDAMLEKKRK
jgi:hypothetical protein